MIISQPDDSIDAILATVFKGRTGFSCVFARRQDGKLLPLGVFPDPEVAEEVAGFFRELSSGDNTFEVHAYVRKP